MPVKSRMAEGSTVSVIIPTHYRNDRLRGAVESVHSQEYDPIEIIVVDDSGEGHAAAVAEDYEGLIYESLDENRGPQKARQVGVQLSDGQFVQFLDDDDRLLSGKFSSQIPVLDSDPNAGVVYSGLVWEDGPTVRPDPAVEGDVLELALQFSTAPCMMGTMLVERDVVEAITPFRHTHGADDIGMKIELARTTEFRYVDDILLQRGNPKGSVSTSQAAVDGRRRIIEIYDELYAEFPDSVRRAALAETHSMQGRRYLDEQVWSLNAIIEFLKAAYYVPGFSPPYLGSLGASAFGRPGYRFSRRLYSTVVMGNDRQGKRL